MTKNRMIGLLVALSVLALAIAVMYYLNSGKEEFASSAEGVFLAEDYEEAFKIVTTDIDVHKTRYDQLLIQHDIALDQGDLKFEIFDPNEKLVQSGDVSHIEPYSERIAVQPIKGLWIIKYYINEETNGRYHVSMTSM